MHVAIWRTTGAIALVLSLAACVTPASSPDAEARTVSMVMTEDNRFEPDRAELGPLQMMS